MKSTFEKKKKEEAEQKMLEEGGGLALGVAPVMAPKLEDDFNK